MIRDTIALHRENNAAQMAGALSFYIILSILPLTLIPLICALILISEYRIFHPSLANCACSLAAAISRLIAASSWIVTGSGGDEPKRCRTHCLA